MTCPDESAALADVIERRKDNRPRDEYAPLVHTHEVDTVISALRLSATSPGDAVRERDALNDVGMFFRILRRSSGTVLDAYTLDVTRADYDKARVGYDLLKAALAPAEKPEVSIKPMGLSDGRTDYFVSIRCGDREVTPHVFREEYKAAYHVALYDWLLNGSGEEPDVVAFGPNDWPARMIAPAEKAGDETLACNHCQGNGEIIKDWDKYLHPANLAEEEASVAECPECDGTGRVDATPTPPSADVVKAGKTKCHWCNGKGTRELGVGAAVVCGRCGGAKYDELIQSAAPGGKSENVFAKPREDIASIPTGVSEQINLKTASEIESERLAAKLPSDTGGGTKSEATGKRPIPSVSGDTDRKQQRDTLGVTAGETAPSPSDPPSQEASAPEPVAWIDFADNGNVRLWTHEKSRMAAETAEGRKMTPVYIHPPAGYRP